MAINGISFNIPSNLNEEPIAPFEAQMRTADTEKNVSEAKISGPVQDSLSISNDARTEKEKAMIEELKRIDQEVQQHEAAHQAAAGELFRGKSFTYKIGPDGQRYAVAGDVQIDTSAIPGNPKATIAKMQRIRRAATAPGDPSSQDMKVAAAAAKVEMEAAEELRKQSVFVSVEKPEIKVLLPIIKTDQDNTENSTAAKSSDQNLEVQKNSSSLNDQHVPVNTGSHISILFGSQKLLSSSEGKYIDVSI